MGLYIFCLTFISCFRVFGFSLGFLGFLMFLLLYFLHFNKLEPTFQIFFIIWYICFGYFASSTKNHPKKFRVFVTRALCFKSKKCFIFLPNSWPDQIALDLFVSVFWIWEILWPRIFNLSSTLRRRWIGKKKIILMGSFTCEMMQYSLKY